MKADCLPVVVPQRVAPHMPATTTAPAPLAYELRVTLSGIAPEIWRTVRVPSNIRMDRLHDVLQAAFGWTNSHLHQFVIEREDEAPVYVLNLQHDDEEASDVEIRKLDERKVTLDRFLSRVGDGMVYEYDFGDSWAHEMVVTAVLPQASRLGAALCLDGARACPPEDCGGAPGYHDFVEAISDPKHEEHESMLEWAGGAFDPEAFDLGKMVRAVARVKL